MGEGCISIRVGNVKTCWFIYQVIELDCCHALIDARDDLLCDGRGIGMVRVQAITKSRDAGCDLVKLDAFLTSVYTEAGSTIVSTRTYRLSLDICQSIHERCHPVEPTRWR